MSDELKPLAFLYRHKNHADDFGTIPLTAADKADGWTETPLYTRPTPQEAQGLVEDDLTAVYLAGKKDRRDGCLCGRHCPA